MIHRNEIYDSDTVTVIEVDTTAQTVTTTVDGGTPTTRALTTEESEHFAAVEAQTTAQVNTADMVAEQDESVDKLVAVVEALNVLTALTNAEINQNPAAVIKDLARECKTIARVANREARMTSGRTESTHTGTEVAE